MRRTAQAPALARPTIESPIATMQHDPLISNFPLLDEADVCLVTADASFRAEEVSVHRAIGELLHAVRELLELDVVFVGEIVKGRRVFRYIDTGLAPSPIDVGGFHPLPDTICQRILDCRLPALIPSVQAIAHAQGLSVEYTALGAHIGVPVRLPNGRLYGMLCGFNIGGGCTFTARDVKRLEIAARSAAYLIARAEGNERYQSDPALV